MDFPIVQDNISSSYLFFAESDIEFCNESTALFCLLSAEEPCRLTGKDCSGALYPGDVFLEKEPGCFHLSARSKSLFLVIFFDYLFFSEAFGEDFSRLSCNSVKYPEHSCSNVRAALIALARAQTSNSSENSFYILHHIYGLFHVLRSEFLISVPESAAGREDMTPKQAGRLQQFESCIHKNFRSSLSMQDVSEQIGYTPQYLSSFLKKYLGCTFNEYLNQVRLHAAVNYLKYRDYDADRISVMCGFSNPASFQSVFRKQFGITPEEFSRNQKGSKKRGTDQIHFISDPAIVREYLDDCFQSLPEPLSARETTRTLSVSCDVGRTAPLRPVWKELLNLGSAENFESPAFREHITMIQKDLGFKYGRIKNIMALAAVYRTAQNIRIFNFSRIFSVLDFLIRLDLIPFLDFGDQSGKIYQPDEAATRPQPEGSDGFYADIISEFLKSCVEYYGFAELSRWKFELWMRYENAYMTGMENPVSYCRRFRIIRDTIRSILPHAQIGAPGYNTYAPLDHLERTLQLMKKNNLQPDFITVYIYPFVPGPEAEPPRALITEDAYFFKHKVEEIRKILTRCHMDSAHLYVTEFSTHIGQANYFNDSSYQASFLIRQYLENRTRTVAMGYWLASDSSTEYPDNTQFLFGGNGIVSRHGIRKPGFHAFRFLDSLGTELIWQGEHGIITHSIDENYQILLYNYAHFTHEFCSRPDLYEITKFPDRAFEDAGTCRIQIRLNGLLPGEYKITRCILNNEHGSAFGEWRKMNYVKNMSPEEIRHFRNTCVPQMDIWNRSVSDTLILNEKAGRNEICFLKIEKTY